MSATVCASWARRLAAGWCLMAVCTTPSLAQNFPSRSVRIVVPYSAGGSSDVVARVIGSELQRQWGQAVTVENRPGASGNIGSMDVVRAPADGYTLLLQNDTMLTNLAAQGKLPYHHENDLTPIMLLGRGPLALIAHPSVKASNVQELQAAGAQVTGQSYGSCGIGSPSHFVMELLMKKTGLSFSQVGYRGCAPVLTDVLGGQIPLAVVSANLVVPHARSGRLRVLGISSAQRYPLLPDVPTLQEQGLQGFDMSTWKALMGPAGLSPDVVDRIARDVARILDDPATREHLEISGIEPLRGSASDLAHLIKVDANRYREIARSGRMIIH